VVRRLLLFCPALALGARMILLCVRGWGSGCLVSAYYEQPMTGGALFGSGARLGAAAAWTFLALGAFAGIGAGAARGDELERRLTELLGSVSASSVDMGVAVVDAADGRLVFCRNDDQPLIPASNQKLLVMAAGLELLGSDFEFRTLLGARGGDLVIIGDGDPAIGDPKLCEQSRRGVLDVFGDWTRALLSTGYESFAGDLIIDESMFDDQLVHPSWDKADLHRWYGAPVGALNLHDNCIEVTVWPTPQSGAVRWSVTPPTTLIKIVNRVQSSSRGVPVIARSSDPFLYTLSGRCGSRVTLGAAPIADPGLIFADVFSGVLREAGIHVSGTLRRERVRTRRGALPDDFAIIATHRTPIKDVLGRIGRNSQNLFAECLAKRVGYEHMRRTAGEPAIGSWVTASAAIRWFCRQAGADTAGLVFADASGLSRDNRVTARQFAELLVYMFRHENRKVFMDSLAVPGQDGSLRKRMAEMESRVIAKTGTLSGVKSLSGYVLGSETTYAFSLIFNYRRGSGATYKKLQDELCRLLAADIE